MKSRMIRTDARGFTLMELMIALGIVALIAAIGVPLYVNYIRSSEMVDVMSMFEAIELEVRAPAQPLVPPVDCENDLVDPANLRSNYVRLSVGSNPAGQPLLFVSANTADNGPDGVQVARDFLTSLRNERGNMVLPDAVETPTATAFAMRLLDEPICGAPSTPLVAAAGSRTTPGTPTSGGSASAGASSGVATVGPVRAELVLTTEQKVMEFASSGTGSIVTTEPLQTGPMEHLAVEFNIMGGPQVATAGIHGATFLSYGVAGDPDAFYAWRPEDLTVRIDGTEYRTGIDTTADDRTHRYSILWDSDTGVLQVLKDGAVEFEQSGIAQGYTIPGGGVLALAQDQDRFSVDGTSGSDHGFATQDAFHGQFFSAALANVEVDPDALASAPLSSVVKAGAGLVADLQMSDSGPVDRTGNHQVAAIGDVSARTVEVDSAVATPNPGATLNLDFSSEVDEGHVVLGQRLVGLPPGSVVTDGDGNRAEGEEIDLDGWDPATIEVKLPDSFTGNSRIRVQITTLDGAGARVTSETIRDLVLDPTQPLPAQ